MQPAASPDRDADRAPQAGQDREKLVRLSGRAHAAIGTVHPVLDRPGLVKRRMARRNKAKGTPLSLPGQPNDLWCADYEGEFMLTDRRYCYSLTITDFASRYLFAREALATTKEAYSFPAFEAVFKEYGLPNAIRTDNGVPFASPNAAQHVSLRFGYRQVSSVKSDRKQGSPRAASIQRQTYPQPTDPLSVMRALDWLVLRDCLGSERPKRTHWHSGYFPPSPSGAMPIGVPQK